MKTALFVAALLFASSAFAQDDGSTEEGSTEVTTLAAMPPSTREAAIADYVLRTGREPRIGYMAMVPPRVCMVRDFDIPSDMPAPYESYAGQVLRLLTAECLEDSRGNIHDYVHDGSRFSRTRTVSRETAIGILNAITGHEGRSASASE